jgi:hypothetical protein
MRSQLFDSTIVGTANEALDFIDNILESSTRCSIIGKNIEGKILLWNEGARPAVRVRPGRSSWPSPTLPSCTFRRTRLGTFPLACTCVSLPNTKRALRGFIPTYGLETW